MSRQEDFIEMSKDLHVQFLSNPWTLYERGCEDGYQYAQTHPNWISVEDELPPENDKTQQSINVWATDGLTSGEFRYNFDTKTWTDTFGDPFDITYWMQLPQPPRNEDKI